MLRERGGERKRGRQRQERKREAEREGKIFLQGFGKIVY